MHRLSVGFIGVGCLGRPMAERLLSRGFIVTVFNRTRHKAEPLRLVGAKLAATPAEAARRADVVITVVGDDEALEAVCLGPEGLAEGIARGATHLEMSTVSPRTARRMAEAMAARGAYFLDAPVLGSGPQAIGGTLIVMVGGPKEVLEANRGVLEALGQTIVHAGDVGSASLLKLVANQFIASMIVGFAQGMVLAEKAGLSPELVMEVLDGSALRSAFYTGKLERLRTGSFKPNFPLKWLLKDIRLVLEAGRELAVPLPGMEAARQVYAEAVDEGLAELDYSAIIEMLERKAGLAPAPKGPKRGRP